LVHEGIAIEKVIPAGVLVITNSPPIEEERSWIP
jgi:hypothetical protein